MTGAGEALGRLFLQLNLPHILVPFLVAAALQTVQGSRVVTMLVAPSLLLPLVPELGLPIEILILAMASGTFVISHVNDPSFWIFGELAELNPYEIFRSNTLGGALMGVVSFLPVSGVYFFFYWFLINIGLMYLIFQIYVLDFSDFSAFSLPKVNRHFL